jgi:hypothetical protein
MTIEQCLATLEKAGLPQFVAGLHEFKETI